MRKILQIAVVFFVSFFSIGFYPLIEVRKDAHFILGHWPLLLAYSTPVKAWQYVVLHLVLSVLATLIILVIFQITRRFFLSHKA